MLDKHPRRFKELEIIPREATRSIRLKELEKHKLIEPTILKILQRRYIAYKLTPKGNQVAKELKEIEALLGG